MQLKIIDTNFSICQITDISQVKIDDEFFFLAKTNDEISLVCPTKSIPKDTNNQDDGWRAIRVEGKLEFSLIGILSKVSTVLAKNKISIFAISTYDTDYILVKNQDMKKAQLVLVEAGYRFIK